jgi:exopolyphosphatase
MAVIALDTMNMDPSVKKGTLRDAAALARLEPMSLVPRQELYASVFAEKCNPASWARFTFMNCLVYDYKQFETAGVTYGCSSILIPLTTWWAKANDEAPRAQLEAMRSQHRLSFMIVQAMIDHRREGKPPSRQLLLYIPHQTSLRKALVSFLVSDSLPLQLSLISLPSEHDTHTSGPSSFALPTSSSSSSSKIDDEDPSSFVYAFDQGNIAMSRKQIVPLLDAFLQDVCQSHLSANVESRE